MKRSRQSSSGSPVLEEDAVAEEQRAILRLPENVVNKIAAGEIIHRPANAIKEMMENSLDAGASMIKVQLKDGGLKMLQIQDDGSGVLLSDMPLLCERFATSKLKDFSDLSSMTTFGFRGEALASISYVSASMTVLSKTRSSEVAYKAYYASGQLAPPKPGQSSSPKPCAGSQGTTITVEDLFYNVPQRRRALKSASEEYNLTLDIMSKYAVHYGGRGIGFTCKKASANVVDLSIPSSPQTSTLDAISLIYGNAVSRELQEYNKQKYPALGCSVEGWVSGPNWSAKKSQFLCFINNRLVECVTLKRSLLALYSTLLPRGGHPWIYLSLEISPDKVDVNIHPTKREVHFLDEEEIVEVICDKVQELLATTNTSRNFQLTQAVLSKKIANPISAPQQPKPSQPVIPASSRPGYPQHMVRTDAKIRTLDAMSGFQTQKTSAASQDSRSKIRGEDEGWTVVSDTTPPIDPTATQINSNSNSEESKTSLLSINELRDEVKRKRHHGLTKILEDYTLVGIVDTCKALSLLQHGTKLYLLQYNSIMEEAAYQSVLRQFGALPSLHLSSPLPIDELVHAGLLLEESSAAERQSLNLTDEIIAERVCNRLVAHADMIQEYFSIGIDQSTSSLTSLPNLSPSQMLFNMERLPTLMIRLATQVDWTSEKECFQGVMRELAIAHLPSPPLETRNRAEEINMKNKLEKEWKAGWSQLIRNMVPNGHLSQHNITEVASLPSLYSVFERC